MTISTKQYEFLKKNNYTIFQDLTTMALIDFFIARKKTTANIAKERLQSIVAERQCSHEPYLPQLKSDLLEVISKYLKIDPAMLSVQLEQKDKDEDLSILELNVKLTERNRQ